MGKLCSCNDSNTEKNGEFYGFNKKNKNDEDYLIIIKKQFNNYIEKDRKFYGKTVEYDNLAENTSIQDIQANTEPIEEENGSVKIIHW